MLETVVLVDADVIAFRAAAATEQREVEVLHVPSGKTKLFDNRTQFKDRLLEKNGNLENLEQYIFKDIQTPEHISVSCSIANAIVDKLKIKFEPDKFEMYLGGKNNFREFLPLPKKYKGNRKDSIVPINLKELKKFLESKGAVVVDGIEADDMLSIRAYEELAKGNRVYICSNDKDTYQAEGIWVYDWTQAEAEPVLIPELGRVYLTKNNTIKGEGLKFFASQILVGDPVDGYKPTDASKINYGAKSAFKLLDPLPDTKSVLEAVIEQYKRFYPDIVTYRTWDDKEITTNWEGMLDLYFACSYMLRSRNDKTTWKEFFKERGVDLT
jgi:hypothetical protein